MRAEVLADYYLDLTDQMQHLKETHRAKREQLARYVADQHRKMREEERALSARRAQIALEMTQTGRNLDELGRMVGVSGPFICQLAKKAERNSSSE